MTRTYKNIFMQTSIPLSSIFVISSTLFVLILFFAILLTLFLKAVFLAYRFLPALV